MCTRYFKPLFLAATLLSTSVVILNAQTFYKPKYKKSTVCAGIEVGSKGVKMSIVEMGGKGQDVGEFNILKDTSVNTDFISFSPSSFTSTVNGLSSFYATASDVYKIPRENIYTVVSSGVKIQAEKEKKSDWVKNLVDSFKLNIKEPQRQVEVVDVIQEARLSHLGIVPDAKRFTTFLIDIGSGNTKGGYFPHGNTKDFKLFQLSWGTKSITNATVKRLAEEKDKSLANYNKHLYRVLATAESTEIIYAVNSSDAYPMNDYITFSGGIAWAVATLLYPEQTESNGIAVSYEEIEKFSERLYRDYASVTEKSILKNLKNPDANTAAIGKAVKTVNIVFDQHAMMAGSGLLLKIMRQFKSVSETKQFLLVKNGQVGWVSAYVDQYATK